MAHHMDVFQSTVPRTSCRTFPLVAGKLIFKTFVEVKSLWLTFYCCGLTVPVWSSSRAR